MERNRLTLLAVALATFMTSLDNNIINVAIPAIQQDLHLTTSGLEWVVSSYILVFASLLLAGGRLADVWGRKRLFLIGLSIFTGASLVAGFAGSVDVLVVSRRKPSGFYGFPNSFVEKKLGAPATSRNWSTIRKIAERLKVERLKGKVNK